MKFDHYLNKLYESPEYKNFRKKYKDEYLCAGFFVLDFEGGKDIHQIDYSLPDGKVATFFLDEGIKVKISETALKKELPKLKGEIKTDIDALKGIVEDEMKNRTVTEKIRKMIAILHVMDNKLIWNLQCILSGLEILIVHIDDSDQSVLKFEKHSLMELIKPGSTMQLTPKTGKEIPGKKMTLKDLEKLEQDFKKLKKLGKKQKEKVEKTAGKKQ